MVLYGCDEQWGTTRAVCQIAHDEKRGNMNRSEIEQLRNPGQEACLAVSGLFGEMAGVNVEWQAQSAPGFLSPAAADGRRQGCLMDGWVRLTVPSEYDDIEGDGQYTIVNNGQWRLPLPEFGDPEVTHDMQLPDEWQQDRNFHHAWYGLRVNLDPEAGKAYWLRFDAVSNACVAFVNGVEVGGHWGGYTPFEFDVTAMLRPGENDIVLWVQDDTAVRDNKQRRMTGMLDCRKGAIHAHLAGIRGGVYVDLRQPAHLVRSRIRSSTRKGVLRVESWLRGVADAAVTVRRSVYEWPDGAAAVLELPDAEVACGEGGAYVLSEVEVHWPDAKQWSPEHPHLYVLRTTVIGSGGTESYDTRFGFREFWIEGKEFILNGVPIRLFGDGGLPREYLSIVPGATRAYCREVFSFLKHQFNYTSTRLHKCVFPAEVIQAADEVGVLAINQSGLHSGYQQMFRNGGEELLGNLEREIGEWYWRDVNSPALVIWDMENELIRGNCEPEWLAQVLRLDDIIRRLDADAIIQHSGAGWYHVDQQVVHVHMQEHYSRIMSDWQRDGKVPLNMGEFWIGGNGETRLPNSYEYSNREDWHREEARLYRERMLEMRNYGVSGIMPHRLTHWPLLKAGPLLAQADIAKLADPPYRWRFPTIRNEGARGMAPVVGFVWPRGSSVVAGQPLDREVVVCNDRQAQCSLTVRCEYAGNLKEWQIELEPARQQRLPLDFVAGKGIGLIAVEVRDADGVLLEHDSLSIHGLAPAALAAPQLQRRVVVMPSGCDSTTAAFDAYGLAYTEADELPTDAAGTIVVVAEEAGEDALGRSPRQVTDYLSHGGRLLVLAQSVQPPWLPLALPFWPSSRASWPPYVGAGWAATNKDLNFTSAAPCYAPGHPLFENLAEVDCSEWGPIDGRVSDDAYIRPNAMGMRAGGPYRVLLGATRRENASIIELAAAGAGAGLLCQARVVNPAASPASRVVLLNALRYLDGDAWQTTEREVGIVGDLNPAHLSGLTGIAKELFKEVETSAGVPAVVIAGDHADSGLLCALAAGGSTVLVLSAETANRIPGFAVRRGEGFYYSGTRHGVADHRLFYGVASGSFLPLEHTPVAAELTAVPEDAQILLGGHCLGHSPFGNDWSLDIGFYGLETRLPAGPVAAAQAVGDGELIVTTLEPWDNSAETHRQLLQCLLANAGIAIPGESAQSATIEVRHTVPLMFDGCLNDWTNDTDDINISMHSHAQPVALTCKQVQSGRVNGDLELSGILYLLYDQAALYAAGILFPADKAAVAELTVDGITVQVDAGAHTVAINGRQYVPEKFAIGKQRADAVIDTRLLNLIAMNRQLQKAEPRHDTPGRTFEIALPWAALGFDGPPSTFKSTFSVIHDCTVLKRPVAEVDGFDSFECIIRPPVFDRL